MFFLRTLLIKFYIHNINTYYKLFSIHDIIQITKFIGKKLDFYNDMYVRIFKLLFSTILYKKDFISIQKNICNEEIRKILNNVVDTNKLLDGKTNIVTMDYKNIIKKLQLFNKHNIIPNNLQQRLNKFIEHSIYVFKKMDKHKNKNIVTSKMNIILPIKYPMGTMDMYVKSFIPSYKLVSSQVAQQTIKKVDEAYKSFFACIKSNKINHKVNIPTYLKNDKLYNVIFKRFKQITSSSPVQKQSFKIIKKYKRGSLLRLSIGLTLPKQYNCLKLNNKHMAVYIKNIKKYTIYKNINNENKKLIKNKLTNCSEYTCNDITIKNTTCVIDKNRIYNSKYIYFRIGKRFTNYNIKEIEIVPIFNGLKYKLVIKYQINKTINKKIKKAE